MLPGNVKISVPERIVPFVNTLDIGATTDDRFALLTVIGLYTAKNVTLAKAAELADKSIWEFIDILKTCGIPWGEYTDESAAMDAAALKGIEEGRYN